MTDDLVSFNMLIVSDAPAERDLLRRAALNASFHIEVSEIEKCVDAQPIRSHFLRENVDFIFLDSRMPKACLLYTSPSPRDGLLSRMPSSA